MMRRARQMLTLVMATSVIGAIAPSMASAGPLWFYNGAWVHQHTYNFGVFPQFTDTGWDAYAWLARGFWDTYTNLTVYRTDCHDCSQMHEIEGYWGQTGWAGLAQVASAYDGPSGHYTHGHLLYNHSYSSQVFQATACQEQGHILGLDHANNGGCMAYGYYPAWAPWPQQDDYNTINAAYPTFGH